MRPVRCASADSTSSRSASTSRRPVRRARWWRWRAQLVRNLAVQWGHAGVRANAISPGVIATEFARPITDDPATAARRQERTPLGRFGRVEEVAGAVVWLASSAGAFTTGQNIVIDGGPLIAD